MAKSGTRLDDQQAAALGHALPADLMAKVDAGAQLYYAIYHHPRAKELLTSDFMTNGLRNAYIAAGEAYRPRR
ncbi:hypothetical protein [Micromonospora tarensis]|uniref:Uncharacterized protein n=1 Tax=Micromonospora tarensis TaxID=2806100 RepID=A0ABS1YCH5_9ACTN|nr:hypothetical protein [Micromonospora tarensis]MBM0275106.1 hypothetical protein [Micromonospora tarensis]